MSVLRLQRDLLDLDERIGRVLVRHARSGVLASAAGSPLGDALDALRVCRLDLRGAIHGDGPADAGPPTSLTPNGFPKPVVPIQEHDNKEVAGA